jgi:hypothetical protein
LKAPCLHLAKSISIVINLKERGFKLPREAARSFKSREFFFVIWEREAAPAELMPDIPAIYGRLLPEFAGKNTG